MSKIKFSFVELLNGITNKSAVVDNDVTNIADSAGSYAHKYITFGAIKTWIKSWIAKSDVALGNVTNDAQVKKIASATDNAITRFDGTTGDTIQNSLATVDDNGAINIPTGQTYKINGSAHTHTIRIGHTFTVYGEIKVPSGDTDYICPFFIDLPTGQTAKLVACRYIINSGTSVTFKLQKNGSDITGFTSLSAGTTVAETDPADVTLADADKIALVVTAVSSTPKNLSVTVFIDYTVS